MAEQTTSEEAPVRLFQGLYTLLCWSGLLLMVAALVWLVWMLFSHTAPGTARSLSLAAARPTMEALAAAGGTGAATSAAPGTTADVQLPAVCVGCHKIEGTSAAGVVGPELTHIGKVAEERVQSPDYAGKAGSAEEYIRESILEPSAYVVPGPTYGSDGVSTMPAAVGETLTSAELDRLVAALAGLQ